MLAGFGWMVHHLNNVDTRLVRVETVVIMQKIMPYELAVKEEKS